MTFIRSQLTGDFFLYSPHWKDSSVLFYDRGGFLILSVNIITNGGISSCCKQALLVAHLKSCGEFPAFFRRCSDTRTSTDSVANTTMQNVYCWTGRFLSSFVLSTGYREVMVLTPINKCVSAIILLFSIPKWQLCSFIEDTDRKGNHTAGTNTVIG